MQQLLARIQNRAKKPPTPSERIIPIASARQVMNSACAKAKLPRFTHRSLHHYFVSNAVELGVDFKTISGWVGHKDGGVLVARVYCHLRDTHSFEMAKRITFSAV